MPYFLFIFIYVKNVNLFGSLKYILYFCGVKLYIKRKMAIIKYNNYHFSKNYLL